MYIGGIGKDGMYYLVWEIVDNVVDEVINGYVFIVIVILYKNGCIVLVFDNGCGILVGEYFKIKCLVIEVIFMMLYVGGKFGGGSYFMFGGFYGVGFSVVNVFFE